MKFSIYRLGFSGTGTKNGPTSLVCVTDMHPRLTLPALRVLGRRALSTGRHNVPAVGAWGDIAQCSRAVRVGDHVTVAGTCAPGDTAADQVKNIFGVIEPALSDADVCLRH